MATPLLTTKLYIPRPRSDLVPRTRLIDLLNNGSSRKLTLISASAGFGKSTLLSCWIEQVRVDTKIAWLSLDEGDNDLACFLGYFIAALQTVWSEIGKGSLVALQSPGNVSTEDILTALLNEIADLPENVIIVFDDYHVIESQPIDEAITFILEHIPTQIHLVIASRIDPTLQLSRLRARGEMTEIRADDLRFTLEEATDFLKKMTDFELSVQDVAALEERTEGWIAGLQLAVLSLKGLEAGVEVTEFINRFAGSDRYIQDYLVDEVLREQPQDVTEFLLETSILNRMSASLCDAVVGKNDSQVMLENLDTANLFIVPLDNERQWYRYHHLFADLLRQRLHQQQPDVVAEYHTRASAWYEKNNLEVEALHHAVAANDFERAARLVEGDGHPLYHRGAGTPVLNWLGSLPINLLDTKPSLWVMYAEVFMTKGQLANAEKKWQAAEAALQDTIPDSNTRDLVGRIASGRASLAGFERQPEKMISLSHQALDHLHPDNLAIRGGVYLTLGYAYQLLGDRAAARQAYIEAIAKSEAAQNIIVTMLASVRLGDMQAAENQLRQAVQTFQRSLQLAGEQPLPYIGEAYLGLARIYYEWNDLDTALHHLQQGIHLIKQIDNVEKLIICEVFLARLKLAQGDVDGAIAALEEASQTVRQDHFSFLIPEVAAAQVLLMLRHGNLAAAANLAQEHDLPTSQIRVNLAQGDTSTALAMLDSLREQMEAKGWKDEILNTMILQAVVLHTHGDKEKAAQLLSDALSLAEPSGFVRIFVDEGAPMEQLLYEVASRGIKPDYISKLLAIFESEKPGDTSLPFQPLVEPLSQRELEVLQMIAQGLSNREISERLYLALDTVKGHNRKIYGKLGVNNRTQAVKKAFSIKIIPPQ